MQYCYLSTFLINISYFKYPNSMFSYGIQGEQVN